MESLPQPTDEELFARFRKGKRDAFGPLVRRYEGELFGYLRRYLGDHDLAADVFQNTFLQVFRKAKQFEAGRPFRPWLYTLATNQAIDAMRRLGRHPALRLDESAAEDDKDPLNLGLLLQTPGPGPLEQVEEDERRRMVRESVDRLPDFLKQVVLLAYFQGLKQTDIADVLGIPVGTVKSRMHTALARLLEAWQPEAVERDHS